MLADEVIAFARSSDIKQIVPYQTVGYEALADAVRGAQRFVLNREAVFLIHSIANIPAVRILPALQICRMPFPKMWVELVYRDRDDWMKQSEQQLNRIDNASSPSRLGFYLEQKDTEGRLVEVTLAWKHLPPNDDAISIGGYGMLIDTREGVEIPPDMRDQYERDLRNPSPIQLKFNLLREYSDPAERDAFFELEARVHADHCRFMAPAWVFAELNYQERQIAKLREEAVFDLLAEWRFILGLFTVLNSRNIITYSDPITYDKLNKARARKGEPPLHDHREIRVGLSPIQRQRLGLGRGMRDIHAHLVRGHFKLRRSGLYWWSPHVRGTGDAPETTSYQVKA